MNNKEIILVDRDDNQVGTADKYLVHLNGLLHRAFSIFIVNPKGEMLIQKRASCKYHFAGLWSNACCSHPKPDMTTYRSARIRLSEELGITTRLYKCFKFTYRAEDRDSQLIEHEVDHVFIGESSSNVEIDRTEIEEVQWADIKSLNDRIDEHQEAFTPWFVRIMKNQDFHRCLNSILLK